MERQFFRFILGVILLGLTACGTLSNYQVDASDTEARRLASRNDLRSEVDALALPLIEQKHVPGVVIGVLRPDENPRFFSYGVADTKSRHPIDEHTLFHIGSLSKGFLGIMAAQLVDEGVLSWDDTLETLLPAHVALSQDAKKITLQQLASHTSGLPRQPFDLETLQYFVEYLFTGQNFYRHYDQNFIYRYLETFKAPDEIGPRYSNIGYGLLGEVVERRTGKKLESLFKERIATPLGLSQTGYNLDSLKTRRRAYGYAGDQPKFIPRGQAVPDWQFTEFMKGSAAMYSTASDLLKLAEAYIHPKPPLDHALADTLKVRTNRNKEAPAIAWVVDTLGEQQIAYQIGMVGGYTCFIGLDVQHKQAVVVLQNSFNWSANIGYQLLLRLASAEDIRHTTRLAVNLRTGLPFPNNH